MKLPLLFLLIPAFLMACSTEPQSEHLKNVKPLNIQFFETYSREEIFASWQAAGKWFNENDPLELGDLDKRSLDGFVRLQGEGLFGYVDEKDLSSVNSILILPEIKAMFPKNLQFMWSFAPEITDDSKRMYALYAVKVPEDDLARIDGRHIKDAFASVSDYNQMPIITLSMTQEGSHDWEIMTRDNIGRCIAITLDKKVLSCPKVINEIAGGNTEIAGNFTKQQAEELAAQIQAGRK